MRSSPTAADLYSEHGVAVFRFLRRMTGSTSSAEDLTQEVFLRVVRGLSDYDHRDRSRAWVFRIARNVATDALRAASRRIEVQPMVADPPAFENPMIGLVLDQALAALPDLDRDLVLLREVAGLDYGELAATCGLTVDAVRMRLFRARSALRIALNCNGAKAPREA